jgi:hypothetical protein
MPLPDCSIPTHELVLTASKQRSTSSWGGAEAGEDAGRAPVWHPQLHQPPPPDVGTPIPQQGHARVAHQLPRQSVLEKQRFGPRKEDLEQAYLNLVYREGDDAMQFGNWFIQLYSCIHVQGPPLLTRQ